MHEHVATISSVKVLSSSMYGRRLLFSYATEEWHIERKHKSTEVRIKLSQDLKSRCHRDVPSKQCS